MAKNDKKSKMQKELKKAIQKQLSNPGKESKEKRKEIRGETFVGIRPVRMDSPKQKAKSRQAIKRETQRRYRDDDDGR